MNVFEFYERHGNEEREHFVPSETESYKPTESLPGSDERIAVYCQRLNAGNALVAR